MDEYTPIDLMAFQNAGLALLGEQGTAPIGPQQFRGLPFLVGTDPQRCFVAFGDGLQKDPLSIPIDESARSIIVAHRLLASGISAGGPVGEPIADYVFTYQSGDVVRVTIRDRFEITELLSVGMAEPSTGATTGHVHRDPYRATFPHCWRDRWPLQRISLCAFGRKAPQDDNH